MSHNDVVVFFDLETGGLKDDSPIIEAAAVAVDMTSNTELEHHAWRVRFSPALCEPKALEVNGYHIRSRQWDDAVSEATFVGQFFQVLKRFRSVQKFSTTTGGGYSVCRIGGHNIRGFDIPRITAVFRRNNMFFPGDLSGALDTLAMAADWFFRNRYTVKPPERMTLEALCKYFDIEVEGLAHEALTDTRLSAQLAWRLLA